ncbi:MAG: chlorophyll synthesis pathway protein BchC [Betaproteobacteria bacterium TMED156]|nr:MAG: chlorophyll synthesis pathway protein BchC [Betaproteobacteria bacterium TMED156]
MNLNLSHPLNKAEAVVIDRPESISIKRLQIADMKADDVLVKVNYSGVSSGTERLLYEGRMPNFPGMGYPLIPGYESIGTVEKSGEESRFVAGERVFVPGAKCFAGYKSLFGGSASRLVVSSKRICSVPNDTQEEGILLALAATAHHIFSEKEGYKPDIIIGHGTLGRLIARISILKGANPVVVEVNPDRRKGSFPYELIGLSESRNLTGKSVIDASGDSSQLNDLIKFLKPKGEVVLAGFYDKPLNFDFAPAFIREAKIRVSAQWSDYDLQQVNDYFKSKKLDFTDIVTHKFPADLAADAYKVAFNDSSCLKMIIDWKGYS